MPMGVWLRLRSTLVSHSLMESSVFIIKLLELFIIITAFNCLLSYIIPCTFEKDNMISEKSDGFFYQNMTLGFYKVEKEKKFIKSLQATFHNYGEKDLN